MEGLPFDIEDHTLRAMRVKNQGSLKHLPVENAVGTAGRIAASRQHNRKNAMIAQMLKSVLHGCHNVVARPWRRKQITRHHQQMNLLPDSAFDNTFESFHLIGASGSSEAIQFRKNRVKMKVARL
jgi:hypothetical protein